MKQNTWKTFPELSSWEVQALDSYWQSSKNAFGKQRNGADWIFILDKWPGGGELETNVPLRHLRQLFSYARIPWRDYISCDKPTWELYLDTEE